MKYKIINKETGEDDRTGIFLVPDGHLVRQRSERDGNTIYFIRDPGRYKVILLQYSNLTLKPRKIKP